MDNILPEHQRVAMLELVKTNGWMLYAERMERYRTVLHDKIYTGKCANMAEYLGATDTLRFIDLALKTPTMMVEHIDLLKDFQHEEYDGS